MNIIFIVMLLAAFTVSTCIHESAHALVALALGDPGPRNDGRISMNPLRQMTTLGTVVAIILAFLSTLTLAFALPAGLAIGWGKPVRFDALKLKLGPNLGTIVVALAGPLANLVLGVGCAFALQAIPQSQQFFRDTTSCLPGITALQCVGGALPPWWVLRGEQLIFALMMVNIGLFLVNLIPLYPLDGYRIVFALLPSRQAVSFRRAEPYMELILLAILFFLPLLISFSGAGELVFLSPFYWVMRGTFAIAETIINPFFLLFYQV